MKTKTTQWGRLCIMILIMGFAVAPHDAADISFDGDFLGGTTYLSTTGKSPVSQFEYAANLDVNIAITPEISGLAQLQMSPGNGGMSLNGPGVVVTDLNITFWPNRGNTQWVMGSFDMPFGQTVSRLSNNADVGNQTLIINPLLYSALGGAMGTLNVIGVKREQQTRFGNITLGITNGTDESAVNTDRQFATIAQWVSPMVWQDRVNFGVAMANSNDPPNEGLGAAFRGGILDTHVAITPKWSAFGYISALRFDDLRSDTVDDVHSVMAELVYRADPYELAIRVSGWMPQGTGQNRYTQGNVVGKLPNPGWSDGQAFRLDQSVYRYELGGSYAIRNDVVLNAQIFWDNYTVDPVDTLGVLLMVHTQL
jgi:hypothetical protein